MGPFRVTEVLNGGSVKIQGVEGGPQEEVSTRRLVKVPYPEHIPETQESDRSGRGVVGLLGV